MRPVTTTRRPSRTDLLVAAVTWVVVVALLAGLPVLEQSEPVDPADPLLAPRVGSGPWWAVLAALSVQAVVLAWARLRPVPVLLVAAGVTVPMGLAGPEGAAGLAALVPAVAVYRATVVRPRLRWSLVAVAGLLGVSRALADGWSLLSLGIGLAQGAAAVLFGWVPGLIVGSRRAVKEAQAGELRALERERDAVVRTAVATERTAMARELHDIAAHHLSGIALMASAIDRQLETDPAAAREGLHQVREQSRVVLTDLRRLVGLLREDDPAETSAWSLASVPGLVQEPATLRVWRGDRELGAGVGPLAQLAGYRMVQESLANARSHAPGAACAVEVDDRDDAACVLTVTNGRPTAAPVPADGGGHGLRGMAERAELVGGDLRYGPTAEGGWQVRLRLPREEGPA